MLKRPFAFVGLARAVIVAAYLFQIAPRPVIGSVPGSGSMIDLLPEHPADYEMRDWKAVTRGLDALVTDFDATGGYEPVVWWDTDRINYAIDVPFIPSYVGTPQGGDALNLFPLIVGATLVGIDKSDVDGHDWVRSMQQFQGVTVGRQIIGNNKNKQRSTGLWYDVMPGIYFMQAVDLYPDLAKVKTPFSVQLPPADDVVSFTGTYTQSFNGLHHTTRSVDLLPAAGFPYHLQADPFTAASGMEGWYLSNVASSSLPYRVYALAGTGSGFVNFGMEADRALGGISNGTSAKPRFGVILRNDTQDTIPVAQVSFSGEQWRATRNSDLLEFSYRVTTVKSIDEDAISVDDDDIPLEEAFVEPGGNFDFTGSAALDGSIDGSTTGRVEGLGGELADLHWLPGDYLVLRWTNEAPGAGLAVGEITISVPQDIGEVIGVEVAESGPEGASMEDVMFSTADKWLEVIDFLGGSVSGFADFNGVVGFNTVTMEVDDRDGTHPGVLESAAGLAWIQYMAYRKFQDERFLTGTQWALNFFDEVDRNPMHNGMQMGYGALVMARMNAELGFNYDLDQMFRWTFGEGQPLRVGWGVLYGSYGGYEVSGLIGSEGQRGGDDRAYAKQGFNLVASLVPMTRYDSRYARAVGKWVLHLASSSRHYYQTYLDEGDRDSPFWEGDPDGVIPFESLRGNKTQSYFEQYLEFLDQSGNSNPSVRKKVVQAIDYLPDMWGSGRSGAVNGGLGLCTYFAGDVGYLGAIIETTNCQQILRLDLLATDFFREEAYPSYLYYNPWDNDKLVEVDLGPDQISLYDTVTHMFIQENVSGILNVMIPAREARVLVHVPAGGVASISGRKLLIDGVVVDYYREGDHETLSEFSAWAEGLPPGYQGPLQDPFGEGYANILRFAFGHRPGPGFTQPSLLTVDAGGIGFQADVRAGLLLQPWLSTDLTNWMRPGSVGGASISRTPLGDGYERIKVLPPEEWQNSFLRLDLQF